MVDGLCGDGHFSFRAVTFFFFGCYDAFSCYFFFHTVSALSDCVLRRCYADWANVFASCWLLSIRQDLMMTVGSDLSTEDVRTAIKQFDPKGNGKVTFE